MMQEELYIIKNGDRLRLDLNTPSGITLNFKSNLFGDLSKISASYSYTFKLPMTLNNRTVLDSPEDIRQDSGISRYKYKCEFRQNGVDLFTEANLYVDNTDATSYNAVMTWGIVAGFDALKDNDMSLRELAGINPPTGRYGAVWHPTPDEFDNEALLLHPYRGMGIYDESRGSIWCVVNYEGQPVSMTNVPVVPVKYIVDRINDIFGTRFNIGSHFDGETYWDASQNRYIYNGESVVISRGVVPLVKTGLTDAQCADRTAVLTNFKVYDYNFKFGGITISVPIDAWDGNKFPQIVTFDIQQPRNNSYFTVGSGGNLPADVKWVFYKKESVNGKIPVVQSFKLEGYLKVVFEGYSSDETTMTVYRREFQSNPDNPTTGNIVMKNVATVKGRFSGYESVDGKMCDVMIFDFRKSQGLNPLDVEDGVSSSTYPFFFNFNRKAKKISDGRIEITPYGKISDDVRSGYETDIFSNLPDIGCMEFMKSLFYVIGAFPGLSRDGDIVPMYYSKINQNRYDANVYDWSKKLMSAVEDNPEKVTFKVEGFAQNNYFLLKNDDLEHPTPKDGEDVYEQGMMKVICDNNSLEKQKTIIQIPWYGAYLKSGKYPPQMTERDMKYSETDPEDLTTSSCEAKPALGIIVAGAEGTFNATYDSQGNQTSVKYTPNGKYRMFMEVFNPFTDVTESSNYDFLQEIVYRPHVITESFRLDEFDLRDIDYTKPVYLEKYNSYFAIVSIQRDANGKCKCELIKLP